MDMDYYVRLYRVKPLEHKVSQNFAPVLMVLPIHLNFVIIITISFVFFLLPTLDIPFSKVKQSLCNQNLYFRELGKEYLYYG